MQVWRNNGLGVLGVFAAGSTVRGVLDEVAADEVAVGDLDGAFDDGAAIGRDGRGLRFRRPDLKCPYGFRCALPILQARRAACPPEGPPGRILIGGARWA